jgi:hypothetical protein
LVYAVIHGYAIPIVDLAGDQSRQVIVDREEGQYLGHPTTVLMGDRRTIFAVYPKGHAAGALVLKRSDDGGLHWSDRLPVPGELEYLEESSRNRVPVRSGG